MPNQQSKRRRKKYEAQSAYAGDVKPTGVLGFLSGANMVKLIFIGMALALAVGGAATIFSGDLFTRPANSGDDFVLPDDNVTPTAEADDGIEVVVLPKPVFTIDPEATYTATIRTELGDIEVELLASEAPNTVNNFVYLANENFYDGLAFHYVASGFSATAGDPACTAGSSTTFCDGGPGYEIEDDATAEVTAGSLSMANGSQFFIALEDSSQFDEYASFGRIVSGLDVAEQLVANTEIQSIDIAVQ